MVSIGFEYFNSFSITHKTKKKKNIKIQTIAILINYTENSTKDSEKSQSQPLVKRKFKKIKSPGSNTKKQFQIPASNPLKMPNILHINSNSQHVRSPKMNPNEKHRKSTVSPDTSRQLSPLKNDTKSTLSPRPSVWQNDSFVLVSQQLRSNDHLIARGLLNYLNKQHSMKLEESGQSDGKMNCLIDIVLKLHASPYTLLLSCFSEELRQANNLVVVMRDRSVSVCILRYIWRSLNVSEYALPFFDLVHHITSTEVANLSNGELSEKEKRSTKQKLIESVRKLLDAERLPHVICALCSACAHHIQQQDQTITKARALEWAISALIFLRFLVPSITSLACSHSSSEVERRSSILLGRFLMKLCCKSQFPNFSPHCILNETLNASAPLFDHFVKVIDLVGQENSELLQQCQVVERMNDAVILEFYEYLTYEDENIGKEIEQCLLTSSHGLSQMNEYHLFKSNILLLSVCRRNQLDKSRQSRISPTLRTKLSNSLEKIGVLSPRAHSARNGEFSLVLDDAELFAHHFPLNPIPTISPTPSPEMEGKPIGIPCLTSRESDRENSGHNVPQNVTNDEMSFSLIVDDMSQVVYQDHFVSPSISQMDGKAFGLPPFKEYNITNLDKEKRCL
jgi:hypothetical protein